MSRELDPTIDYPRRFGAIAVLGIAMLAMTFATIALAQRVLGARDFLGARE